MQNVAFYGKEVAQIYPPWPTELRKKSMYCAK